ncbi:MAG: SDR family NAD(P)-dependent oxidoreductase [Thermodesulfobacteriota bacterium]
MDQIDNDEFIKQLEKYSSQVHCVPVVGDLDLAFRLFQSGRPWPALALKGSEASGFTGSETAGIMFSTLKSATTGPGGLPQLIIWGGVATPEAAAAFLACGAGGIVFESLHWQTDLVTADQTARRRLAQLRPEHTTLIGLNLDVPCRLYDKGNSLAVKELSDLAASSNGGPITDQARRAFAQRVRSSAVPPLDSDLNRQQVIFLGPEAAWAEPFALRFGRDTTRALANFREETIRLWNQAPKLERLLADSPAAGELGIRYPLIQGAMSWISDVPEFALAVADAGGLPTLALGLLGGTRLEKRLLQWRETMASRPYAVNLIALPENPHLEEQLTRLEATVPPWVVIAAGDPTKAVRLMAKGIKIIYIAPETGLLRLALQTGVRWIVLEGNEAGGHIGLHSTLTLAQMALELKRQEPELFAGARLILAGGIHNRQTAFWAAMLGADAVQIGTAYLTTGEIVTRGALSRLYQKMILDSPPGGTAVSGQTVGLRVRALKTPKLEAILDLERQQAAAGEDELIFRRRLEALSAGSLLIAAKNRRDPEGEPLDEETCLQEGQFMSGAAAGALNQVTTVAQLHRHLVEETLAIALPPSSTDYELRPSTSIKFKPGRERVAITGLALTNSLGGSLKEIWAASLAMKSGVIEAPGHRLNPDLYYDPAPGKAEKTYTKAAAFHNLKLSRQELGIAPQDFRTMAEATRLTLFLARQAVESSGILAGGLDPERIGVIVSQNSGEAASTLSDIIISLRAKEITLSLDHALRSTRDLESALIRGLRAGRLTIDDTTLLGRLNATAGGFISNKYGFRGPVFSVSAACASSLVALYNAWQMIKSGVIDAAVVGGGEELLTPAHFVEFSAVGALAGVSQVKRPPQEMSRPFDAGRDGMVLGEGGAVIVIERESLARKRGAFIHAYLCGAGASNNDRGMIESEASNQLIALRNAFEESEFDPATVDLVECHATSTVQGDIEELKALKSVFPSGRGPVLTSFKSQIGHTLGASGLGSLVRGVMALEQGVFPGTLNYEKPDPRLGLEDWGFRVLSQPEDWPRPKDLPRRLMVNAFGFGGANFVVHLEEERDNATPILVELPDRLEPDQKHQPDTLTGAFSLFVDIAGQSYRVGLVADSPVEAQARAAALITLEEPDSETTLRRLSRQGIYLSADTKAAPLALVFAGQGTSYPGMGQGLYQTFPVIRRWMDKVAALAEFDLLSVIFNGHEDEIKQTLYQQPALYCLEYAVLQQLLTLGLEPVAVAGHSMGELTALAAAGVFSWEDGFRIVNKRAQCMDRAAGLSLDPGVMFAVDAPLEYLEKKTAERTGVHITNYNSPKQMVLGGTTGETLALMEELNKEGYRVTRLKVSMAFHSPIMKAIHQEMEDFISRIELRPPRLPVLSNTTMKPYPGDPTAIREIIMAHLESPVHWMQNAISLWRDYGARNFLEIGPRATLCNLIGDTLEEAVCLNTCAPEDEVKTLRAAAARLFALGHIELPRLSTPSASYVKTVAPLRPIPIEVAAPRRKEPKLGGLIQREINTFVLESFGKFLKPAILAAIRREYDPSFPEERLDDLLKSFPDESPASSFAQVEAASSETVPLAGASQSPAEPAVLKILSTTQAPISARNHLEEIIQIIMEATGYERNEIDPDMDLRADLAIRSSRLPLIMDAAERKFNITITVEDFLGLRTVRQIADRIAQLAGEGPPPDQPASPPAAPIEPQAKTAGNRDFLEQVIQIIMEATGYERGEIDPDMDLRTDLAIRSSRLPLIMDAAERKFNITITVEDFLGLRTVREIADQIAQLAGGASSPAPIHPTAATERPQPPAAEPPAAEPPADLKQPRRSILVESSLPQTPPQPLVLPADSQFIILSFGRSATCDEVSRYAVSKFGVKTKHLDIGNEFVLEKTDAAEKAAGLIEAEAPAGLILVFGPEAETAFQDPTALTSWLTGYFRLLKSFVRSPRKKMCLMVAQDLDQVGFANVAFEGVLGALLAAAHEYNSILFRAVTLNRAKVGPALDRALDRRHNVIHLIARNSNYYCPAIQEIPIPAFTPPNLALAPGDVVVISGGGRGITAHLAKALARFKPRMALLGRSASNNPELTATLTDLARLGTDAVYHQCDVADPIQVESALRQVAGTWGRIDGVIHGAGLIRDSFMETMPPEAFSEVMKVKLNGAWNLFQAAEKHGLKFMAALSSIAGVQGNPGQVNYAAANRAMSALLSRLNQEDSRLTVKALTLPPIEGAGMADNQDIKELLKLKGMSEAYLNVAELAEIFCRELFLGPPNDSQVFLLRDLPRSKAVHLDHHDSPPQAGHLNLAGVSYRPDQTPMIDGVRRIDLIRGEMEAVRFFDLERDLWLSDHKPFKFLRHPLVSGIMAVETFLEAARMLYPYLIPLGLREVHYREILECPPQCRREAKITCRRMSAPGSEVQVEVRLASRDISPTGRPLESWTTNFQGVVELGGLERRLADWKDFPIMDAELDTKPVEIAGLIDRYGLITSLTGRYLVLGGVKGTGPGAVKGWLDYKQGQDIAALDHAVYQYSPYLLEALLHLPNFYLKEREEGPPTSLPVRIGELRLGGLCRPGERLMVESRRRAHDREGHTWDARAQNEAGQVVMEVEGLYLRFFQA